MASATKFLRLGVVLLGLMAGAAGQARAGLLGDSIHGEYLYPTVGTVNTDMGTLTVSPIATFNSFGQTDYAVSNSNITITNVFGSSVGFTPATFNGVSFTDVSRNPDITGVSIDPATNLAGFNASLISFTSNEVFVNLQSLTMLTDSVVSLDLKFQVSTVPEPSTLIGAGTAALVGLGYSWRRRRRAAVA